MKDKLKIALAGSPNSGKSSLFNALTGLRQKVGNFPGVTVDRKIGKCPLGGGQTATLIDLPGIYTLYPKSGDEAIAVQVLTDQQHPDHPDVVVVVADSTHLRRSLLLCTQIRDLGIPLVLALNMSDLLDESGIRLNEKQLQQKLGIPVVSVSALRGTGIRELRSLLSGEIGAVTTPFFSIPESFQHLLQEVKAETGVVSDYHAFQLLLTPEGFREQVSTDALREKAGISQPEDLVSNEIAVRYDRIDEILRESERLPLTNSQKFTDKLDRWLIHPVFGYVIFVGILLLIFQALFAWSSYPMDWIDAGFSAAGEWLSNILPDHFLSRLLVDGIWAGLGGIVIFVPQIAFLFLFIAFLEGSGYMSRVVFLMDRIMRPFGFSGKSVIPLIGGMACAVPSIMMARTISNRTERLITIMVTPLMSCSARIPVYVLLISMFVPDKTILGVFNLQGLVMTGMYFLGFFMSLAVALVLKKIYRYTSSGMFVTELPIYRFPPLRRIFLTMYHKSRTFVVEAGKVILLISIFLWFLASYGPGNEMAEIEATYEAKLAQATPESIDSIQISMESELLRASYAGHIGKFIEPVIKPLGFDWKIGIAVITSFAAREVFVGTMATIYSAGEEAASDQEGRFRTLRERMFKEVDPVTGEPVYTLAVGVSLLLFYAFAMQCMSTLAIVRRETGSWKLTGIMLVYMTALAYISSLIAYQLLS